MVDRSGVLAEYWSGHGHAGPSHGRERDEIGWGTDGDFARCVALVTEHGKMTPEQAKGYCNLRHHDALGEWPAQHAARERGKSVALVEADPLEAWARVQAALKAAGSEEARVPAGSVTGGQFSAGSDGPAKKQPNPFARGKKPRWAGKPGKPPEGSRERPGKRPSGKPPTGHRPDAAQAHTAHVAHLRHEITQLTSELSSLEQQKKRLSTTGVSNFGTSSTVKPRKPSAPSSSTTTASTASSATGSSSSSRTKPAAARPSAASPQLAAVNAKIASVKAQLASVRQQLQAATSKGKSVTVAKVGPHGYSHGWIKAGTGSEVHDHLAQNYKLSPDEIGQALSRARSGGHANILASGGKKIRVQHLGTNDSGFHQYGVAEGHGSGGVHVLAARKPRNSPPAGPFGTSGDSTGKKSVRNPRDLPSGRFRTFQGEISEAKQALAEGRIPDVVELLGSARALAQTDQERMVLGSLQAAMGRVQHVQPTLTKSQFPGFTQTYNPVTGRDG